MGVGQFCLTQAEWPALLDQLRFEFGVTVRVPAPFTEADGRLGPRADAETERSLAQLVQRLREARTHLRERRPEDAVRCCRLVLDNIQMLDSPPSASAAAKIAPQKRSQEERWAASRHDLHSLLCGAHHDDDVVREFIWTLTDAEVVLGITAALASRVAQLNAS